MNKIKIILICLITTVSAFIFLKLKAHYVFQQKTVLAVETRKVLVHLMTDLVRAHENSFMDVPVDGQWHNRIAINQLHHGILEYVVKNNDLWRVSNGEPSLIANHIASVLIRRQIATPGVFDLQIDARNNVDLISNLRLRIRD